MEIWAVLYLVCALIYAIYLILNLYFRRNNSTTDSLDEKLTEANLSNSSSLNKNFKEALGPQAPGPAGSASSNFHGGVSEKNSNINSRLEQINKSINILEEKILKSGKVKKKSYSGQAECTTGLDYLRKGLRNRKKQIPKHEKDIKFEQMDKERRQAKQAEQLAEQMKTLPGSGTGVIITTEKCNGNNGNKTNLKTGPSTINTSMSSLSSQSTCFSSGSSSSNTASFDSKFIPGTETTSVESYNQDAEKANIVELQSIMRQVTQLRGVADLYKKRGRW